MKKTILILLSFVVFSCGQKPQESPKTDSTALVTAPTTTKKTLKDYFEAYKSKQIDKNDTLIVHKQSENYMLFEHYPPNSEIGGTIFVSMLLVADQEGSDDYLVTYFHSAVEGSCNVALENLKIYSADLQDVTANLIDMQFLKTECESNLKKLQKEKPKGNYDGFYATFDTDTKAIRIGIVSSSDEKLMSPSTLDEVVAVPAVEIYWDNSSKKYVKDYPAAG